MAIGGVRFPAKWVARMRTIHEKHGAFVVGMVLAASAVRPADAMVILGIPTRLGR